MSFKQTPMCARPVLLLFVFSLHCFLISYPVLAQPFLNLDFEAGSHQGKPHGWYVGGQGYTVSIDTLTASANRQSLRLSFQQEGTFGVATQNFPVDDARGKTLTLSGYIKTDSITTGYAGLWLRVDGKDKSLLLDNMSDRGIHGTTPWTPYTIDVTVDSAATGIAFGALLTGNGTAWVDALSITLNGIAYRQDPLPEPRRISEAQLNWLRDYAITVRSIEPDDDDFTDLHPLKQALGDTKIVLLGEQSHGDGTTFLAKARLIKFLHQEMGFDVLAFESGLYDCHKAWQFLQQGEEARTAVPRGVFGIWTGSEQVQPVLAYLGRAAGSEHPLELAGFDSQFTASASSQFVVADLEMYLKNLGSGIVAGPVWPRFASLLQHLADRNYVQKKIPVPSAEEQEAFTQTVEALKAEMASTDMTSAPLQTSFWRQVLESTEIHARMVWAYADPANTQAAIRGDLRDAQMGKNLVWLSETMYPDRKIIVWAATFHVARNLHEIDTGNPRLQQSYTRAPVMGDVVWEALGETMYTLGFTAYTGEAGAFFRDPRDLSEAPEGSLEAMMHQAGFEYAIVDFRHLPADGAWLREPILSRPLGYAEMKADWTRIMDGIMFTREMKPSTRASW